MNIKIIAITSLAAITFGCANSGKPVAQNSNSATANGLPDRPQTAIAHGPEMQRTDPAAAPKSRWSQGGDPVDTSKEDSAIMAAEKALREKPSDPETKRALGAAFFKRASLLTEARQYASALGDYRRAIKQDPSNAEAKEWIDRIVSIYASINKESPKEGEEPPPLPFDKTK
jgi:tetratricopeptide (TPR) repeat protein